MPQSWVVGTLKNGVTLTYSGGNNGLVISGQVTAYGCGGPVAGALTLIKGYWTKSSTLKNSEEWCHVGAYLVVNRKLKVFWDQVHFKV